MVEGLSAVPFSLVCLANNHSMDYGEQGLQGTLRLLRASGLSSAGVVMAAAETLNPFVVEVCETSIAVLNISEGEEGLSRDGKTGVAGFNVPDIKQQLSALRRQYDIVIVIAHAGREFIPFPPPYIQSAYRGLIDAGADAVIAHHPHVAQGVEIYQGKAIAYSLGNFVFERGREFFWSRLGYMLRMRFSGSKMYQVEMIRI